jgi:hypothetical protein
VGSAAASVVRARLEEAELVALGDAVLEVVGAAIRGGIVALPVQRAGGAFAATSGRGRARRCGPPTDSGRGHGGGAPPGLGGRGGGGRGRGVGTPRWLSPGPGPRHPATHVDPGEHRPDGHDRPLGRDDLGEDARQRRRQFHGDLVGHHLDDRLVDDDRVADGDQPLQHLALHHRFGEFREFDVLWHGSSSGGQAPGQ